MLQRHQYDAVVVGIGISGLAALRELLDWPEDCRVLVIDREKVWTPWRPSTNDDLEAYLRSSGQGLTHFRPELSSSPELLDQWWTSGRAGGGFNRWYGQVSRFQREDVDGSFGSPWPFTFEQLQEWYERVEQDLLPFACSYGWSEAAYRELDCRNFRLRPESSFFERHAIDRLREHGTASYIGQTCLGGRAWEKYPVDPMSLGQSPDHPLLVRPNYYTAIMQRLFSDPRFEISGECLAETVEWNRESSIRIHITRGGKRETIRTRLALLGCGPLATISLLLRSGLGRLDHQVGKGITFTLERVAYALLGENHSRMEQDELIGRFSSVVVKSYYTYETSGQRLKGGKHALYDASNIESEVRRAHQLHRAGANVADFLAAERSGQMSVKLSFKGESDVSNAKFVALKAGKVVLQYEPTLGDMARQMDVEKQIREILEAIGAKAIYLQDVPEGSDLISAHHHGGVLASETGDGVLDRWCQVSRWPGVYVVDGSFMPTSGGTNSSLTVMANARRVASHALEGMAG